MMRTSLLFSILAACGGGSDGELDRLLDDVEIECGTLELGNTPQACPDTAAALQCFDEANTAPHITQIFISDEGDPIFEHFFVEDGSIVLVRDTREDDFGPQEITRTTCAALVESEVTGNGCTHLICE
jgi:hypothetical protein